MLYSDTSQPSRIMWECPGYDTNLPVSCTGRFISLIKSSFELFCALVGNLAHFLAQNLNFSYS